ncbi:acyl-CoA synthetase [Polaromonas jejuensis]|uniref:Acyl-CoA synthetase n=1 Tax=Polaromonas jejuensis TaxID=457502 RepID=A0ABW0QF78_9BURK|nr:acyl-CoA synthetase [Polaromonas jejuensis]
MTATLALSEMSGMPQGLPQVMNLGNLLTQTARKYPGHAGLIQGDRTHSWSQINRRVDALAHHLQAQGVRPGDRILVQMVNGLPLFESGWAAFKLGAVWVPVNYRLTPAEVAYIAQSSGASLMLTQHAFDAHAAAAQAQSPALRQVICADDAVYEAMVSGPLAAPFAAAEVTAHHPLWFFFTSGTTGHPKAAVLTHGQMAFVITNHLADLLPGLCENQSSLVVAPLSHGAGIHALVNVARGAASILLAGESLDCAAAFEAIEKHRVSNLFTVPTILKRLAEDPAAARFDHASLKQVIYAGAPMSRADQRKALDVLGAVIVQYFGLGEVTGNITVLRPDEHLEGGGALLGTCGTARTAMEVAVLDEHCQPVAPMVQGEICTRGPAVFAGYWNNPQANAQAFRGGWFHTGDLGTMDERGFITITGRSSDMYISGGSNVYPREIEEALRTMPEIAEAVVFGIPDPQWGEVGVAVLAARDAGAHIAVEDVLAHLQPRLAKYKWPRSIEFWTSLPTSAYGKLVKKDIRAEYLRRQEARLAQPPQPALKP